MDNMNNKLNGIQLEMTDEYAKFVEKFKPKKTTDDCYTPPNIYETVKTWAVKRYGLENTKIIRPFYPDGDYTREDYPDDCALPCATGHAPAHRPLVHQPGGYQAPEYPRLPLS